MVRICEWVSVRRQTVIEWHERQKPNQMKKEKDEEEEEEEVKKERVAVIGIRQY